MIKLLCLSINMLMIVAKEIHLIKDICSKTLIILIKKYFNSKIK